MPGNPGLTPAEMEGACWRVRKAEHQVPTPVTGLYLSQLAFEQGHVRGRREDDVLTRRQSVNKPQASGLGLCYECT